MIHKNIAELTGNTPLVEMSGLEGQKARMDRPCQRIQCDTHYAWLKSLL